ncbi:MAG: hypothetical protein U9N36_12475 [Euryarchaeota archaeon]|nr:hypothetical protein [Euryarchaeota archaeon]
MNRTTKSKGIGIAAITALLAALLIAAVIAPAMAGEEGTRSIELSGGQLTVDETGGITCTADAVDHNRPYVSGQTYRIVTDYDYIDTPDVLRKTAYFKLTGPDGSTDDKSIRDQLVVDDSDDGTIVVLWSPSGPGDYHYTIYCSEGSESATDIGDIKLT